MPSALPEDIYLAYLISLAHMEKSCQNFHMKRKIATNIPAEILSEATQLSGLNQTAAIIEGLRELIKREKIQRLIALRGKLTFNYDVALSRGRTR